MRASESIIPRLYAIVDVTLCRARGLDPAATAAEFLLGGAKLLQIRDKEAGSAAALALAERVVASAAAHGARVVVNDRADVARLSGAAGVHLGQEDLPVDVVRPMLASDAIVGLSTHAPEQVDAALRTSATYIAVGPVYGTKTKDTGYEATGPGLVTYAAGRGTPVVAIGGVTLDRVAELTAAGAASVAVISDLLVGAPRERVGAYLRALA